MPTSGRMAMAQMGSGLSGRIAKGAGGKNRHKKVLDYYSQLENDCSTAL